MKATKKLVLLLGGVALFSLGTRAFLNFKKIPVITKIPEVLQAVEPKVIRELTKEEYAAVKKELVGLLKQHDPKFILTTLRERVNGDAAVLKSCHALAHVIGHEAYEKYHDFGKAMQYQDEICNSGYLHGIIESHFEKSKDVFATMQTVCNNYPAGKYTSWQCYHGVGHGVMYFTENDLKKSLALCDIYKDAVASESCTNGVFMENFNADQKVHLSR